MPYDPYQGAYVYQDEQIAFPQDKTGKRQPLPRKDIVAAARQQAAQARQQQQASKQYAGHSAGIHPEDQDIEEDERYYATRPHTSARRYTNAPTNIRKGDTQYNVMYGAPPTPRRSSQRITEDEQYEPKPRRHIHWLFILGLGMLIMIVAVIGFSYLASWWKIHQDDATYGRPRTFQIDTVVGHNDSTDNPSHFIALNLNRHVVIIELPGGDSSKAKIYSVTTLLGDGQDLTPVTLSFKDVNHDGLLDMEIHIQDQTIVLLNDQGSFRPLKQGEKIHL